MKIPIVFAPDNNVVVPCGVSIISLLSNAARSTLYDIYIICEQDSFEKKNFDLLSQICQYFPNCKISFIDVGSAFEGIKSGRITKATYYRLLLPSLFPDIDKLIYADTDVIFQQDLSTFYLEDLDSYYLAGALDLAINNFLFDSNLPKKIGKDVSTYINAGVLLLNLDLLRKYNKEKEFLELSKFSFDQNDQDILNIACDGKIKFLPSIFNFQTNHYANYMWGKEKSEIDFSGLMKKATLHYTGPYKPWNSQECVIADAWWHYYRLSPFFENEFYFKRQYDTIESFRNDFHNVPTKKLLIHLLSRIKNYFIK